MTDLDDQEAIRRCRAGDCNAFAPVVRRHQAAVLSLCLRMTGNREDAADAAQQTFVNAYTNLSRYDPRFPVGPWLLGIAANACVQMFRNRKGGTTLSLDEVTANRAVPESSLALQVEQESEAAALRRHVAALPEPYRTAVILYYFAERSYDEIARYTGWPIGSVGTYLHRAKGRLKRQLQLLEVKSDGPHHTGKVTAISKQ